MKRIILFSFITFTIYGCHKDYNQYSCNLQQIMSDNSGKVTITNGVWGTASNTEGNCMPMIGGSESSCHDCPIKETLMIYQYTLLSNATPTDTVGFYSSFNAPLVAQVTTDDNGFFQTSIPPGHYSIGVIIHGKLYVGSADSLGGICPFTFSGGIENIYVATSYGAAF